jgi:hypothetical protein
MKKLLITSLLVAGTPGWGVRGTYDLPDYGERNDGSSLSSQAFRSANQAARAAGGGTP